MSWVLTDKDWVVLHASACAIVAVLVSYIAEYACGFSNFQALILMGIVWAVLFVCTKKWFYKKAGAAIRKVL